MDGLCNSVRFVAVKNRGLPWHPLTSCRRGRKGGIIVSITGEPDAAECARHGIRGAGLMAHPDAGVLGELTKLIEANKITPIVSRTFPLTEMAEAHRQVETHHTRGKIVIKIAAE